MKPVDSPEYARQLLLECVAARENTLNYLATARAELDEVYSEKDLPPDLSPYNALMDDDPELSTSWEAELARVQRRITQCEAALELIDAAPDLDLPEPSRYTNAALRAFMTSVDFAKPIASVPGELSRVRVYLLAGAAQRWAASFPGPTLASWRPVDLAAGSGTGQPIMVSLSIRTMNPGVQIADMEELIAVPVGSPVSGYAIPSELVDSQNVGMAYTQARAGGYSKEASIAAVLGSIGPEARTPGWTVKASSGRTPTQSELKAFKNSRIVS